MNEHERLEAELASLMPRPASPELKRRIAQQLTQREPASVARQRGGAGKAWLVSLALGLALVVLAVISMPRREPHAIELQVSPLDAANAFDPALPSVWTYHRAVSASAEEIDALLDKHSRTSPTPASEFHVSAFSMSQSELQSF
jgi:hypothetical protein